MQWRAFLHSRKPAVQAGRMRSLLKPHPKEIATLAATAPRIHGKSDQPVARRLGEDPLLIKCIEHGIDPFLKACFS
jgi:hypothetical protein